MNQIGSSMHPWDKTLLDNLNNRGILYERTSFLLNSNLTKLRDWDWETILQSGQIVEIVSPKRKGDKLKVKAIDSNNLPVEIGTVGFYNDQVDYNIGIICQLIEKDLIYSKGNKRNCLEFNQPIILINSEIIPDEIIESKVLNIKSKGKPKSQGGCSGSILIAMLLVALIVYYLLT